MLWPSAYSPAFTTSDVLRLAFTVVVTAGVINELRNIAAERTVLLAQERMYTRRLEDLAVLRADFTAMVAHELASPLAGIRRSAELIDPSVLPVIQQRAIETIQSESKVLAALVDDVQVSARAEREDFAVRPRPVPIADIVAAAASYGRSIGGDHSIDVTIAASDKVLADPDRIGQVLRNLVSNSVKFSPDGTTISLCAVPIPHGKVRFEVIDRGWGIHPDDMSRIFEKFGRGRSLGEDQAGPVPGVGLGLYLSRRIVYASGSELNVASDPGGKPDSGSTWSALHERPSSPVDRRRSFQLPRAAGDPARPPARSGGRWASRIAGGSPAPAAIRRQGRYRGRRPRSGRWQRCGPDPRSLKTESRSPGAGADPGIRDEREHGRAIAAGASGIVSKTASTAEIAAAIRRLNAGVPLMAPAEARALMERGMAHQRKTEEERALLSRLSPREREVLAAVTDGLDNEAIAGRMSVGTETVRSHICSILRKLEVDSRLQAAVMAIRNGYGKDDLHNA